MGVLVGQKEDRVACAVLSGNNANGILTIRQYFIWIRLKHLYSFIVEKVLAVLTTHNLENFFLDYVDLTRKRLLPGTGGKGIIHLAGDLNTKSIAGNGSLVGLKNI